MIRWKKEAFLIFIKFHRIIPDKIDYKNLYKQYYTY